jgi:hypothetical protein
MIKAELEKIATTPSYPYIAHDGRYVAIMIAKNRGTVIHSIIGVGLEQIGKTMDLSEEYYRPLVGTIALSNG